jgi:rhodanese-related sulfurtransferase
MSFRGKNTSVRSAEEILTALSTEDYSVSADEIARMIVEQDSGIQIVDVRNPERYKAISIPGALNIPLPELFGPKSTSTFSQDNIKTIFYADDEVLSYQAWMLSMQKGYHELYILKGGLAAWDSVIMKTVFTGDKISAEENSLFEKRYKARRLFAQWNVMPDTMKNSFFATKKTRDKELVGGCE